MTQSKAESFFNIRTDFKCKKTGKKKIYHKTNRITNAICKGRVYPFEENPIYTIMNAGRNDTDNTKTEKLIKTLFSKKSH